MSKDYSSRGPMICRACKREGRMSQDCPPCGPLICLNCNQEGKHSPCSGAGFRDQQFCGMLLWKRLILLGIRTRLLPFSWRKTKAHSSFRLLSSSGAVLPHRSRHLPHCREAQPLLNSRADYRALVKAIKAGAMDPFDLQLGNSFGCRPRPR